MTDRSIRSSKRCSRYSYCSTRASLVQKLPRSDANMCFLLEMETKGRPKVVQRSSLEFSSSENEVYITITSDERKLPAQCDRMGENVRHGMPSPVLPGCLDQPIAVETT